jgi:CDP-paratose 2-epimerase
VELHGYLAYIIICAVTGRPYTIYGFKGKQVRDQIHCRDVASLFLEFYRRPRAGEVYNLGGGRSNSLSILETIDLLAGLGFAPRYQLQPENRIGDHICYISDLRKVRSHFPGWQMQYNLPKIVNEILERHLRNDNAGSKPSKGPASVTSIPVRASKDA